MKRKWLRFLKYGLGLLVAIGIFWGFVILYKNDNWLGISALATLLLALAAFLTIRNSNEREKRRRQEELDKENRDRKDHLLNEIIEWATNVAKCGLETGIFDETIPVSGLAAEQVLPELLGSVVDFRMARAGSVYISNIASEINPELKRSVDNLTEEIKKQIKLLMEYRRKITPTWPANKVVAKIAGNNERVYSLATTLIEETVKIKTRDIGKQEENMSKEGEATGSNEPKLKDIEEHLKWQDRQMARGSYVTGAAVGASIILVAVTLWVGRTVLSTDAFYWTYIFLLVCGFGFMSWCWYKQRKIKG